MVGDDFPCVFLGWLVVTEPGVTGGRVKDPLCVVEHEVVFGVFRLGQLLQQLGAMIETSVDIPAFTEPGLSACLLKDELDHGVSEPGVLLSGLGVVDYVVVAAFCQGEPGGEFVRPCHDFAVPGLLAHLVGGLTRPRLALVRPGRSERSQAEARAIPR